MNKLLPIKKNETGFTAVELLITITIAGIIATLAIPSYQDMLERNRLKQALESLKADLQLARTEALKRHQPIVVSRTSGIQGAWCYGLAIRTPAKANCNCEQTNIGANDFCDVKRILGNDFEYITMEPAGINNNTFNPRRGTVAAGGVTFSTAKYAARVVFADTGRVRICRPQSANMPSGKVGLPSVTASC
ncbi:MAG: hypothetical protein CVV06_10375 [Gammaproteobacteria bacterium HGW-Gammaproteobacteria-10]|nr:MAG: hypothetical protein CVV06_10375 [Gammaproteobacteria bacterium HGW-Gammaproteobacteria-10]